jgi:hypothetical protein
LRRHRRQPYRRLHSETVINTSLANTLKVPVQNLFGNNSATRDHPLPMA